ncbi:MAG: polyprenyl diphosphate synthase [Sulfolobales archaeon]|nr:polyprenyl diphosphate synthase [Sulfolobales archaeon]MDW8082832.1 polyprenyl diphosphate synthase [Sulfolobales archaeon]
MVGLLNRVLRSPLRILLRPAYRLYEKLLWEEVKSGPLPKHVAIIPDGNRRWARELGLDPNVGHEYGYRKIEEVLRVLWRLGVKVVTVYAMSSENCVKRDPVERSHLFGLIERAIRELESSEEIKEKKVRVKVFGRLDLVPPSLTSKIREIEVKTESYDGGVLNIALCYGGRDEILRAVREIARDSVARKIDPSGIDESTFRSYLYTSHLGELGDPDLVIRTSGEVRISNFLLWQIAYSELYFCEVYWPEFRVIDLLRAIRDYQKRERRFGV